MGGNTSKVREAREKWESKIYKRVPYAKAREQFQQLSLIERKAKIWDECPISANVHVVHHKLAHPPKVEFIHVYAIGWEAEGSGVGVGYKGRYKDLPGRKYHIDNSLGYVLGSPLYRETGWPYPKEGRVVVIDPALTIGLSRLQYESLFKIPTISSSTITTLPTMSTASTASTALSAPHNHRREHKHKHDNSAESKSVSSKPSHLSSSPQSSLPSSSSSSVAKFVVSPPGGISFSYEPDNSTSVPSSKVSQVSQVLRLPSAPPLEKLVQEADVDADTTIVVLPVLANCDNSKTAAITVEDTSTTLYEVAG